jgi:F1F0 ATPase subunit 2
MTWFAALITGTGAGLAYFGGLWLTLRLGLAGTRMRCLFLLSYSARLILVALTFYALSREGAAILLAGLAGLLVARRWLLAHLGGTSHAC